MGKRQVGRAVHAAQDQMLMFVSPQTLRLESATVLYMPCMNPVSPWWHVRVVEMRLLQAGISTSCHKVQGVQLRAHVACTRYSLRKAMLLQMSATHSPCR
jgi:hypothetical protein